MKYRFVIVNPEALFRSTGEFEELFADTEFSKNIISIVFDEAHCITKWREFRAEYSEVGRLRFFLPNVPLYATSATLPQPILDDVKSVLGMTESNTEEFHIDPDRTNIFVKVSKMQYSRASHRDLVNQIFPHGYEEGDEPPPMFIVFFDQMRDAEDGALALQSVLPPAYRDRIVWFHSVMSDDFRTRKIQELLDPSRPVWGICATDACGMVWCYLLSVARRTQSCRN